MIDKDNLQRFLFENAPVRGEIVHLNNSFQAVLQQHPYPPLIRQLLGEALAAVNLLTATIKFKGRLTLQFQGKGQLKLLLAQSDHQFHFRGLAQWTGNPETINLSENMQEGVLAIMIDSEAKGPHHYQGLVPWQGHSLAESLEGYFKHSEQLPTRIWLAVNENSAAGLLLQVMPEEKSFTHEETFEHMVYLTETLTPAELLKLDNLSLLHRLFHQEKVRVFENIPVDFRCTCSQQRSEQAIRLLGQAEAEEELQENKTLIVTCEFCNKGFTFDKVDVARIFKKGDDASTRVH